ncbi:MAG: stage II sporulation protein M [Ferruginibacter sp.]
MREAMFIKKNREKWHAYQHEPSTGPDETAERFITLIDDLGYAKTFYPRSRVTEWINGVAAGIYQNIYRNRRHKFTRIINFWKLDVPLTFRKYHKVLLFTFLFFAVAVALGVLASVHSPEFIRSVLGGNYVDMTEDNISRGDPFGVYKDNNPFSMFVRIAFNNIKVAFYTFAGGFVAGIFTMYLLWSNGIMLGTFHYLFFSHGMGFNSILVVWIHGTVEIASIVIAGTAGLVIARGMLFPNTYSRLHSFRNAVKDAAKMLLCLVPFFIIAAYLESYITRLMSNSFDKSMHTGMPVWMGMLILITSLASLVCYFIIWPRVLYRRLKNEAAVVQPPVTVTYA